MNNTVAKNDIEDIRYKLDCAIALLLAFDNAITAEEFTLSKKYQADALQGLENLFQDVSSELKTLCGE